MSLLFQCLSVSMVNYEKVKPALKSLVLYRLSYGLSRTQGGARRYFTSAATRMCTLFHVRRDAHVHDAVRGRHDPAAAGATLQLVDELHALHHLAADGVLPVQMRCRGEHDVELAVAAVRRRTARHPARAA